MQLVRHTRAQDQLMRTPPSLPNGLELDSVKAAKTIWAAISAERSILSEVESKALLAAYGIPVVTTEVAVSATEVGDALRLRLCRVCLCSASWRHLRARTRPVRRPSSTSTRRSSPSPARWRSAGSFYQGGLINRRAVLRSAYAQFVYLVGGADHDQMERMRAYLSAMATGWDVQHGQGHRRRDAAPHRRPARSTTRRPR